MQQITAMQFLDTGMPPGQIAALTVCNGAGSPALQVQIVTAHSTPEDARVLLVDVLGRSHWVDAAEPLALLEAEDRVSREQLDALLETLLPTPALRVPAQRVPLEAVALPVIEAAGFSLEDDA